MTALRAACAAVLALALAACETPSDSKVPPFDSATKGFPPASDVRDSVYLPVDRRAPPPAGYGLYTVLLTRSADRNSVHVLAKLFSTSGSAREAALARENLNLITIPVKSAAEATREMASARNQPEATAATVLQKSYDFGQAALLIASVCRPELGAAVARVCGARAPDGPLLVTTERPLDGTLLPGQRMLIVNLSATPEGAIPEVLATYRRQISSKDFADRSELDGWRLRVLNEILDAARLLPSLSKAYAGTR